MFPIDMLINYVDYITQLCNFLENDFWTTPPPPINFVHGSYMLDGYN